MKSTRSCKIEEKVFSKKDLIDIAKYINKESNNNEFDKTVNENFQLKINCLGNISYESANLEIFEENDIIDRKKIESIHISFSDFKPRREIDLFITEGNRELNQLRVSGEDSDWVISKFHNLTELIEEVKPQTNVILKNKKIFSFVGSLILSILSIITVVLFMYNLFKIGAFTIDESKNEPNSGIVAVINGLLMLGLFMMIWKIKINNIINSLWFSVEFDFGPKHLQKQKNSRKAINTFIIAFIIPLIFYILSVL
ncbi:hypothetical protein V7024_15795 [Bacillus sp. JJ864]|uniref:hypothetical protein n=1 Tax=Bacillus sp. JJ864 TaxID=3122975 RepID=UPI002FFDB3A0